MPYRYPGVFNDPEGIVRSGLVAHYRFGQRSGQTLWDYSDLKSHGTLVSATWTVRGLTFGGAGYVLLTPHVNKFPLGNASLTLVVVCSSTSSAQQIPFSYGSGSGSLTTPYIWLNSNNVRFETSGVEFVTIPHVYANTGPMFLVWRYNASSLLLDGIVNKFAKYGSITLSGAPDWKNTGAFWGRYVASSNYLIGTINYGLLYNRPISNAEVINIYSALRKILAPRGVFLQ